MPNTASARKSLRQNAKRRADNNEWKGRLKRLTKSYRKLLEAGKKDGAQKLVSQIYKTADKMAAKGRVKRNKARRVKSRLTRAATQS